MYWHYHNDNEDGRKWTSGRLWLNRTYAERAGWFKCDACHVEWAMPPGSCGWGITFGAGDSGRDVTLRFTVPFLLALYFTVENVFPIYYFGADFDRGHDRSIELCVHDWSVWYHVWVGSMASWSRDYSWCRWWRQGSLHVGALLGRWVATHALERTVPVQIPMPEGVYHGTARIERWVRGRRFWFKRHTTEVWLDIPKGIPHAGKGENSWDCGDDGLFGIGGSSVEDAMNRAVTSVLDSRRRHGHASPETIERALAR